MTRFLFTRRILYPLSPCPSTIFKYCTSFLDPLKSVERGNESCTPTVCRNSTYTPTIRPHRNKLPTLIPSDSNLLDNFHIELVDHDIWPQTLGGIDKIVEGSEILKEDDVFDEMSVRDSEVGEFSDFDEIEDLRLRRRLFYKLDRDSKEFEEYNIKFHLKKTLKKDREKPTKDEKKKDCKKEVKQTKAEVKKKCKKMEQPTKDWKQQKGKAPLALDDRRPNNGSGKELIMEGKRVRTPTFNQLTSPYHLPFCLDIFITKGSVRASIIHRATSKVVAVAHSISKDLKFDVGSRKDAKACAAVGVVLAQRAIEDDIHNVVYTPRKGDKIEGKLQIVLQSIIDGGIDVKVKLKQKRSVKRTQK